MRFPKKYIALGLLLVVIGALMSCAPGNERWDQNMHPGHLAGFWAGIWHGLIIIITFIVSLFTKDVGIYELHNTGWSYDLGFLIGLCFSVLAPWRFRPKKKKVVIKPDWDEIGTKIETHIRAAIQEHIDKTKKEDWEQELDKIVDRIEERIHRAFEDRDKKE